MLPVSDETLQEIVCCMGQPVAGNPTQFMMEAAFEAAGLDWRYLTLEVPPERLGDAVRGMRAMGFRGGNFTIPHKVAVLEHLDELSEAAELMGAVNCIAIAEDGRIRGENTDGKGFLESLRSLVEPEGKRVVLFGAGGAARAIAVEIGLAKAAEITIVNRTAERAAPLVSLLQERVGVSTHYAAWEGDYAIPEGTDVVINATSIGLSDPEARVAVDGSTFREGMVAADVIFNPPETIFLKEAAAGGCQTLDGLGMLVHQGVIGFQLWTGVDPDASVMREALEEFLELP